MPLSNDAADKNRNVCQHLARREMSLYRVAMAIKARTRFLAIFNMPDLMSRAERCLHSRPLRRHNLAARQPLEKQMFRSMACNSVPMHANAATFRNMSGVLFRSHRGMGVINENARWS